ncbi:hypothetical protein IFM46972_02957 [Aspergillus udagawae]|uniref:Uncharacterized protein n=1 Tax=Aspergillus udagawae TaxID=91492 RepID=A0A8H3NF42_9EURO|nr:hypothetical protein IFM46972_02957 [Aspergillus udagawae]
MSHNKATLQGDFHILPNLSEGMIIGTDACQQNRMIIDFTTGTISINGHKVHATASKPKLPLSRKKRSVYAATAMTIQPNRGAPLPVRFSKHISQDTTILQLSPVPQVDTSHDSFGSLPYALISTQNTLLPYANMGDAQIRIRKGQLLGYVSIPGETAHTEKTINLIGRLHDDETSGTATVLNTLSSDLDDAPIPGTIESPQVDPTLALDADVSDHWGTEYSIRTWHWQIQRWHTHAHPIQR